ncbi:MAG: thermonuclease family protein [Magnetospirillum sp. WYHS-4]
MFRICALGAALSWAVSARADILPGPYPAEVLRVVDGDSFRARVQVWPGLEAVTVVRIAHIDAPELAGGCAEAGQAARAFLESRLSAPVFLLAVRPDKYGGRVVAQVRLPGGEDLADLMLSAGHARPYAGGRRAACPRSAGDRCSRPRRLLVEFPPCVSRSSPFLFCSGATRSRSIRTISLRSTRRYCWIAPA